MITLFSSLLNKVFNTLPYAISYVDPQGIYQFCNTTWEKAIGLFQKDIIGKSIVDVRAQDVSEKLMSMIEEALRIRKEVACTHEVLSGTQHFQLKVIPCMDSLNETILICEEDITSQVQSELKWQQQYHQLEKNRDDTQSYLENIVSHFPANVYWKDKEGRILGDNLSHAKMAGFNNQSEILGKTDYDFPWKQQADRIRENDLEVMKKIKTQVFEESALLNDATKENIFLTTKTPLYNASGEVVGVIGISMNITERKQHEIALKEAKDAAEAANKAETEFIANMSHDIKTPIAGIISTAEHLMHVIRQPEYQMRINSIAQSGLCLLDLINEIIELSRLNVDEMSQQPVRFKLKELTLSIEKLMQPIIHNKGLTLEVDYRDNLPTFLIGYRTQLYRVLINLVANAIKFTHQGGVTLRLEISKETSQKLILKLTIKDTGIGIPKDKLSSIFEKFTRLDPSFNETYKGSGLGLHIAREFINAMKGEIYVKSEVGKGSEFICVIPFKKVLSDEEDLVNNEELSTANTLTLRQLASSYGKISSPTKPAEPINVNASIHILLIEDNEIAARAASDTLTSFGAQVTIAYTGKSGLELFEVQPYNFVYMDVGLPDMQGVDVAKELSRLKRIKGQTMPVFALSAHVDENLVKTLMEAGLDGVYSKPLLRNQALKDLESIGYHNSILEEAVQSPLNQPSQKVMPKESMTPIIDLEAGTKITRMNTEEAKNFLSIFLDELTPSLKEIERAYVHRDLSKFIQLIHKLHGSLCYCGAPRLKENVKNIEIILNSGAVDQWEALYQSFLSEVKALQEAFAQL